MHRAILVAVLATAPAAAQVCASGDLLLKNDSLPAVPSGATPVAIVPGLCQGEAAMAVLDTNGPVTVNKVSVMFGNVIGTNGVQAAVDVELYDGATLNATGRYTLGPLVWRLSVNGGSNAQIQTHAINEINIPGVAVASGRLVVGFRMVQTLATGSCTFGYTSNFCTDNSSACVAGRNVIDALSPISGPVDPVTFAFPGLGTPLCGTPYWRGDWIIRACVTPSIGVNWSGNPTPGGAVLLDLNAPGHANEYYVTLLSLGTQPGWNTPWGLIPLNPDFLLECSLTPSCWPQIMTNNIGTLNGNAQATAVMLIPNLPFLLNSGLTLYSAFFTSQSPTWLPFSAISSPSAPIVIN